MEEQSRKTIAEFEIFADGFAIDPAPATWNPFALVGFIERAKSEIEKHNDLSGFVAEGVVARGSLDLVSYSDIHSLESDVRYEGRVYMIDNSLDLPGWNDE